MDPSRVRIPLSPPFILKPLLLWAKILVQNGLYPARRGHVDTEDRKAADGNILPISGGGMTRLDLAQTQQSVATKLMIRSVSDGPTLSRLPAPIVLSNRSERARVCTLRHSEQTADGHRVLARLSASVKLGAATWTRANGIHFLVRTGVHAPGPRKNRPISGLETWWN